MHTAQHFHKLTRTGGLEFSLPYGMSTRSVISLVLILPTCEFVHTQCTPHTVHIHTTHTYAHTHSTMPTHGTHMTMHDLLLTSCCVVLVYVQHLVWKAFGKLLCDMYKLWHQKVCGIFPWNLNTLEIFEFCTRVSLQQSDHWSQKGTSYTSQV